MSSVGGTAAAGVLSTRPREMSDRLSRTTERKSSGPLWWEGGTGRRRGMMCQQFFQNRVDLLSGNRGEDLEDLP